MLCLVLEPHVISHLRFGYFANELFKQTAVAWRFRFCHGAKQGCERLSSVIEVLDFIPLCLCDSTNLLSQCIASSLVLFAHRNLIVRYSY